MKGLFGTTSEEARKHENKNGGLLLEELIAYSDGKYNPIRMFSSDQILKATNKFDKDLVVSQSRFTWYKGIIEERSVLIKKWEEDDPISQDNIYRDISVLSMMSSHNNVLKLLGCCLEFCKPVIVCEYAENGTLQLEDKDGTPLPWSARLKIGKEIANAVAYLHTAFPRVIINRDITPQNIFLDENRTVKLSSFCLSISIPEGESCVFDDKPVVYGLSVDPDYSGTGLVSENFDVYSFGVTMLFLLAGELGYHWLDGIIGEFGFPFPVYVGELADQFIEMIDTTIWKDESECSVMQVEAFFGLALRCIRFWPKQDVPNMIDVAKELKAIEGLVRDVPNVIDVAKEPEEVEGLVKDAPKMIEVPKELEMIDVSKKNKAVEVYVKDRPKMIDVEKELKAIEGCIKDVTKMIDVSKDPKAIQGLVNVPSSDTHSVNIE